VGSIKPFLGGKPTPQLFTPEPGYSRSNTAFESTITHIFTARLDSRKDDVSSAWNSLVAALKKEGLEPKEWSGWGIEEAEGVWLGLLGGDDIEVCFCFCNDDEKSFANLLSEDRSGGYEGRRCAGIEILERVGRRGGLCG
jgi:hypothetical protein